MKLMDTVLVMVPNTGLAPVPPAVSTNATAAGVPSYTNSTYGAGDRT